MPLLRTNPADARAFADSYLGQHRANAWTPSATADDCSYFQSFVLFGGRPGPIGWCDNWKAVDPSLGQWHRGHAGMQPGDVIGFDWDGNGVLNHVAQCRTPPTSSSVGTCEANSSTTIAVTHLSRPLRYVQGYFRPAWGVAPNPEPTTPEDEMNDNDWKRLEGMLDERDEKIHGWIMREARQRWYVSQQTGDYALTKILGVKGGEVIYVRKADGANRDAAFGQRLMVGPGEFANATPLPHDRFLGLAGLADGTDPAYDSPLTLVTTPEA